MIPRHPRNALVLVAFLLAALAPAPAVATECTDPAPHLLGGEILALPMDCGQHTASATLDASGHGNDASFEGGDPARVSGRFFGGYELHGNTIRLRVLDDPTLDVTGGFSFAMWVKPDQTPAGNGWVCLIMKHGSGGFHVCYNAAHPEQGDTLAFWAVFPDGRFIRMRTTASTTLPGGQWTHLAGTLSQSGDRIDGALYANGAVVSTNAIEGEDLAQMNSDADLFIGRHNHAGTDGGEGFDGHVDEALVYNRSLSAGEVTRLATYGVTARPPSEPLDPAAATGPGAGEITLTWSAPASDGGVAITNYRVYAGDSPGSVTFVEEIGAVLTWTESGLGNGVTRYYRVSAMNAIGEGALSVVASGVTATPPGPPQHLNAATQGDLRHIALSWMAPESNGGLPVTSYVLYRTDLLGREVVAGTVPGDVTSFVDLPPEFGVYRYRATAANAAGTGPRSNEACAVGGDAFGGTEQERMKAVADGCIEI